MVEEKLGHLQQSRDSFKVADIILGVDDQAYPTPPIEEVPKEEFRKLPTKESDCREKKPAGDSYGKTFARLVTSKESRREFRLFVIGLFSSRKS